MIEKIYNGLVSLYRKAILPMIYSFIALYIVTFISTVVFDVVPMLFNIAWMILGGAMVAFGLIAALFHILLGIKLNREGKLDDAGNAKKNTKCNVECCIDFEFSKCTCKNCECQKVKEVKINKPIRAVKKKTTTKKSAKKKKKCPTKRPINKKK